MGHTYWYEMQAKTAGLMFHGQLHLVKNCLHSLFLKTITETVDENFVC